MNNKFDVFLPLERINRDRSLWSNRILTEYVAEHAVNRPNHVAVAEVHPNSNAVPEIIRKPSVLTYSQLWREVRFLTAKLRAIGIQQGDVVSVQLPNWAYFVVINLALTRLGAVINPIAPIYRQKEVGFYLRRLQSKAIIVPTVFRGFNYVKMIEDIRSGLPDLEFICTLGDPTLPTSLDPPYNMKDDHEPSEADLGPAPTPDDVNVILFTAGTTGEPKGVLHTHNTVDFVEKALAKTLRLTPEDVFWFASTLGHGTGYYHGYTAAMRLGATLVLPDIWDPLTINDTLNKWHCTYTVGATPFLVDTIEHGDDESLRKLRIFLCGGAFIPAEVMRRARERMPNCFVLRCWGQTENSTITVNRPGDPMDKIITSDGRLNLNKEVQVREPTTGEPLPVGSEGELWTRGPSLFVGYHKRPDLTREAMDNDGWFRTGDRGRLDGEGYLTMSSRIKDLIIRGGENFPVKEMEDLLSTHPAVSEVAIVAMPDLRLQEKACAYVSIRPGFQFNFSDMLRFLDDQQIAKRKYPEHLEILPDLPKTTTGKIKKYELRAMIAEKVGLPPVDAGVRAEDL